MTTQTQLETNESLLGAGLMQHLKSYIQLFVSETAALQDVDISDLSTKVSAIINVIDGDPESEGYQIFQGIVSDVADLKATSGSNTTRITAVETALNAMDTAWRAEIARAESESKTRDTALGVRIDGVEATIAAYAAARTAKDVEHDSAIAGLQAAQQTIIDDLAAEVTRAVAKEQELQAAITANTAEIDAIKQREVDYATRGNVDSGFAAFCTGAVGELWAGRTMPAGLPTFSAV